MRLCFTFSPSKALLAFDYPYRLSGVLHKWLGLNNPWHDALSLYSFGWLEGGRASKAGLEFPEGAKWFVSGWEGDLLQTLLGGALRDAEVFAGMRVQEVRLVEPPTFSSPHTFRLSGPALLKAPLPEGGIHFLTFKDGPAADAALTAGIRRKLDAAGLAELTGEVQARFLADSPGAKTKLVTIKGISNRASHCPIVVDGPPEVQRFVWLTGVGHSTGVGFGSLK